MKLPCLLVLCGLVCGWFLPGANAATGTSIDVAKATAALDKLIDDKLSEQKIQPNAAIDDATFLRRIYLDLIGRIPTLEEAEAFHADTSDSRRAALVDRLLGSDGYVSNFYHFCADLLRINQSLGTAAAEAEAAYQLWVKNAIRDNMPYDEVVRKLITARGYIWDNGAVGYYQRDRGMPLDNMSNTVRIFLGTRLECAQCHNHPFDKWTQMDFYQMAAFSYGMTAADYDLANRTNLAQRIRKERADTFRAAVGDPSFPAVERQENLEASITKAKASGKFEIQLARLGMTEDQFRETALRGIAAVSGVEAKFRSVREAEAELFKPIRYISADERKRDLQLPHDYKYPDAKPFQRVGPKVMFGDDPGVDMSSPEKIEAYASWLTSPGNPTFTRVIANRLWKKVFGIGVFEPVDEITDHMVISNPALLTSLEDLMKTVGYDMQAYLRVLYNTKAYQRAADSHEIVMGAPYYFQGPVLRRMSAEQIWDSVVGLAIPEADSYRPRLKTQLAGIERVKLIHESLSERSETEYVALVEEVSKVIQKVRPGQEEARKAFVAARAAKDEALIREKRQQLNQLDRELYDTIGQIGYTRLKEKTNPEQLLAALGMNEKMAGESMAAAGEENVVVTSLPRPQFPKAPEGLEKDAEKQWRSRMKGELQTYNGLIAGMARASELQTPAPRGHFLREFGQSDREVIENSNSAASVPQALNLLNGPIVEALVNPFAVFGSRLSRAGSPEETAKLIFQAMLTRQPTPQEVALVQEELNRSPKDGAEGVVWALLNTRQFLFVR